MSHKIVSAESWKKRFFFFSVKSAYWVALDLTMGNILASSSSGGAFDPLWNANIPGKVAICIWRGCHDLLPTRDRLRSRGYQGDLRCILCSHNYESLGHVFCQCSTARNILEAAPFNLCPMATSS